MLIVGTLPRTHVVDNEQNMGKWKNWGWCIISLYITITGYLNTKYTLKASVLGYGHHCYELS
jgi:hypothetical protein